LFGRNGVTVITAIFNAYNADRQMRKREKIEFFRGREWIFHLVFKRWKTILQGLFYLFIF